MVRCNDINYFTPDFLKWIVLNLNESVISKKGNCKDKHRKQNGKYCTDKIEKANCVDANRMACNNLSPVVQSVVSLTSLLRVISLTVVADSIYNILKSFAEKM